MRQRGGESGLDVEIDRMVGEVQAVQAEQERQPGPDASAALLDGTAPSLASLAQQSETLVLAMPIG